MRRRARHVHLARRRLPPFLLDLETRPVVKWPPHLRLAFKILKDELELPEQTARTVMEGAISAAHECAQAINQRSSQIFEHQIRAKLGHNFRLVAKCVQRSPGRLRKRLDESIGDLVKEGDIDLEVVEAVFDTAAAVFAEFPDVEPSRTALRQMRGMPPDHGHVVTIKSDYASIGAIYQRKAEKAIAASVESGKAGASNVFEALAGALCSDHDRNLGSQTHDLITQYVAQAARVWRQVGLRPSRARHPDYASYKSKFHRFVDLVLAAMIEPEARRHLVDLNDTQRKIWGEYSRLPAEARQIASRVPKRADVDWLVSEDHLKKALRIAAQKIDPDTP